MSKEMVAFSRFSVLILLTMAVSGIDVRVANDQDTRDGVFTLLHRLERVAESGRGDGYLDLLAPSADKNRARDFASLEIQSGVTRAVVQERDRRPLPGTLPGNGYQLMVDAFVEYGARAHIATWKLDVKRTGDADAEDEWQIVDEDRITVLENLYRLSLNPTKRFAAHDLRISAQDLELMMSDGSVFVADTDAGVTALVLLGRGDVRFHPTPGTEKGQVKIFCGAETLASSFDAAFIRINPSDFGEIAGSQLVPQAVDAREFRRADEVFREEAPKSFALDLADLSRDSWTLLPPSGDFLAEIRTRRFDTLTYARSSSEAEDITLFDRKRHRNIAIYPSEQKLASRGRFYNEDDLADYDVVDYDISLAVTPARQWIEGQAKIKLKIRSYGLMTLTLRLADPLVVQSIVSDRFGRLFGVRVRNQNSVVVNLPTMLSKGAEVTLTVTYAGRLAPQEVEREAVGLEQGRPQSPQEELPIISAEPNFLYSSRAYWYPQGPVTDYATATLRISVPAGFDCVASGELAADSPTLVPSKEPAQVRKEYVFKASQPIRYLAFIVSRFVRAETATIAVGNDRARSTEPKLTGVSYHSLNVAVESNPRQVQHGHDLLERAADIAQFYTSLIGDCPYPSFTIALVESNLPGGHSPGYFAALNQPLPTTPFVWHNDPAAFTNFPDFFIAHELAHQWWGQAVGWRNYHEQWLSEGFAQYFAALYAQHERGDEVFTGVLRQLRRWGMDSSDQGPIYLGYRLGHIRGDSRVFRALVYDKSAAVLHMLRRLIGDDAFFGGVQRFYRTSRFRKVGTEDLRTAMEKEAGRPLDRFFERWIYGSTLPRLRFSYRIEPATDGSAGDVAIRVEQVGDQLFDVPLTAVLQYEDRKQIDVTVPVGDRVTEVRLPLAGTLRGVVVRTDDGTLAEIVR